MIMKRKPIWQDLNPKAVTNDELFGYINPATREWKDGKRKKEKDAMSMRIVCYSVTSFVWL